MYINNVKFAEAGQELKGKVELSQLERVQEIDGYSGTLDYVLVGKKDKLNRPTLSLRLYGIIHTLCQNCLQPMEVTVDNTSEITIFFDEDQLDASLFGENSSGVADGVLAEEEFDVVQLLEDEVIMLIPYATKHESCIGLNYTDEVDSPFKVLKNLI